MLTMFIKTSTINFKEVTVNIYILSLSQGLRSSLLPNSLVLEHIHWVSIFLFFASIFILILITEYQATASTYSINTN